MHTVEEVGTLLTASTVTIYDSHKVFLDLLNRDITFPFTFWLRSQQPLLNGFSDNIRVNNSSIHELSYHFGDIVPARKSVSSDNTVVDLVSKVLFKFSEIPGVHGFKTELFLEHRVDVEKTEFIVLDVYNVTLVGGKNDRIQAAAVLLEGLDLLGGLRESIEKELVAVLVA